MRWIKYGVFSVVAFLVLATAALAIAGMGADSNRSISSVVIRRKPAAIWPFLYQSDKVKQWVSWLVEVREDGQGDLVPGGKATWVMEDRNNGNQRMEITGVVESVEPLHKLAITLSAPAGFRGTSQYTLTEQPDGSTLLESDARYIFDNGFARFMTPLVLWQAKKKMLSDMDHLRAILEAQP